MTNAASTEDGPGPVVFELRHDVEDRRHDGARRAERRDTSAPPSATRLARRPHLAVFEHVTVA